MLTSHEAKLYLAEKLPERIQKHQKYADEIYIWWKDGEHPDDMDEVRETEWQQIALWVEEKMTYEQRCSMAGWYKKNSQSSLGAILDAMKADYTTRVTAMKEAGL
jgi:hypothetical protein